MSTTSASSLLFPVGKVIITARALAALRLTGECPEPFLERHQAGDWAVCEPTIENSNRRNLVEGSGPIFSVFHLEDERRLCILTDADRSATTIGLEGEL
jgi:hypothetical protein